MADQANLISDVRLQFQDFFGSLSLGKRITILAALGVILAGMVSLILIANRPAWAPLYSNLDPGDAARVVEKLQENQIAYLLAPCLLYTSPSPRDRLLSRMPSSA